jgi:hypothetical protein
MTEKDILLGFKKDSLRGLQHLREMEESLYCLIALLKNTPDWQKKDLKSCLKQLFMENRETQYDLETFFCLWVKEKFKRTNSLCQ